MELYCRAFGEASSPPLVVLHGLLGSSRNWQGAGSDLGSFFHTHCLDLRNHGRSPHRKPHSYAAMVKDVLDWVDRAEMDSAYLLGHSMGGKLAMRIACDHPDRVCKLVVVDIAPKTYPSSHDSEYDAMRVIDLGSLSTRREADQLLEPRVPDWGTRQFLLTNLVREESGEGFRWQVNIDALEENQREIEASPVGEADRFEGPTLFVMGGASRYSTPDDYPKIGQMFPDSAIDVIDGSGHNPHFEYREAFVSRVANFLNGDEAGV